MIPARPHMHPQATSPLQVLMSNETREEASNATEMSYEDFNQMLYEDGSLMLYEG